MLITILSVVSGAIGG